MARTYLILLAAGVLINVARGEIVDEEALADALQRDHLRGPALDVYVGEFKRTPTSRLWSDRPAGPGGDFVCQTADTCSPLLNRSVAS